jgi:hypothetical protein
LLLAFAGVLFANDEPGIEKRKSYSKSYPVSSTEKISINNQFGEVKILTWDKAEVQVNVEIMVKASTEEKAQTILDHIKIEDGKNSNGVFFTTQMNNQNQKNNKGHGNDSQSMEINYEVHMPGGSPLDLINQFGKTNVPDLSGPVEITQKFGDLVAGHLSNVKKLDVEFGTAMVESVSNADVSIKFSQAQINNMIGAIKTFQSYSGVKLKFDNAVTSLTIKNEFTDLKLDVNTDLSANFDIYTNFSELENKTSFKINEEEEKGGVKFDHQYNGKSGDAKLNIKVKSNFGDVTLGHNLAFNINDDKDDNDEKPEKREKKERKERKEKK